MPVTFEALMARCDALEASLAALGAEYECPGERMEAFAGIAEDILHDAALSLDPHDHSVAHLAVQERLDGMLIKAGWIPQPE